MCTYQLDTCPKSENMKICSLVCCSIQVEEHLDLLEQTLGPLCMSEHVSHLYLGVDIYVAVVL